MQNVVGTTRRKLLQKAAIFLGGAAAALAIRTSDAHAAVVVPPRKPRNIMLKLYGRHWHLYAQNRKRGELPTRGEQMVMYGDLLKEPQDDKIGEFYANCLSVQSPFGTTPFAATNVEIHSFNLVDGTILGMGATRATPVEESVYNVVGGSGRYAGVTGTYKARQQAQELGGDGTAEFTFDLTIRE